MLFFYYLHTHKSVDNTSLICPSFIHVLIHKGNVKEMLVPKSTECYRDVNLILCLSSIRPFFHVNNSFTSVDIHIVVQNINSLTLAGEHFVLVTLPPEMSPHCYSFTVWVQPKEVPYIDFGSSAKSVSPVFYTSKKYTCYTHIKYISVI